MSGRIRGFKLRICKNRRRRRKDKIFMKAISIPTNNGENVTLTTRKKKLAIEKFKGDTFRV